MPVTWILRRDIQGTIGKNYAAWIDLLDDKTRCRIEVPAAYFSAVDSKLFSQGEFMRFIICIMLACILVGCATVVFQPYEGKSNLYEGDGGTKVVVDGIDFWANGSPPRKYSIIGMVVSEIGSGRRSAHNVAAERQVSGRDWTFIGGLFEP